MYWSIANRRRQQQTFFQNAGRYVGMANRAKKDGCRTTAILRPLHPAKSHRFSDNDRHRKSKSLVSKVKAFELAHRVEHLDRFGSYFRSGAVAADDGNFQCVAHLGIPVYVVVYVAGRIGNPPYLRFDQTGDFNSARRGLLAPGYGV